MGSEAGPTRMNARPVRGPVGTGLVDVLEPRAAMQSRALGIHDGRKRSYREVGDELGVHRGWRRDTVSER